MFSALQGQAWSGHAVSEVASARDDVLSIARSDHAVSEVAIARDDVLSIAGSGHAMQFLKWLTPKIHGTSQCVILQGSPRWKATGHVCVEGSTSNFCQLGAQRPGADLSCKLFSFFFVFVVFVCFGGGCC
jgi:hypothetical protein